MLAGYQDDELAGNLPEPHAVFDMKLGSSSGLNRIIQSINRKSSRSSGAS